ncbi:MAG TPA: serine hydrolase domain-containing protein, partial [Flavobacteriales bacterium]|nr:serine hydrolase domain-containing protein [Flavobacteriales bacterium]
LITTIGLSVAGYAQTGIAVPQMTGCDAHVQSLLSTFNIPGASFALSRQGKLVYDRAFGNANLAGTEPVQPYHRFRLASLSKPITGVAAMAAVQQGLFSLDDHPFGAGGLLADHPYLGDVVYTDQRLDQITIRQLLQHTAGWDRDINCFPAPTSPYTFNQPGCDPIVVPLHVTQTLGETGVITKEMLVRFLMEGGLDHNPGSTYAYSNIGYLVVGICIEVASGMSYESYVQELFAPVGVCDLQVGNTLLQDKLEREVEYRGEGGSSLSLY